MIWPQRHPEQPQQTSQQCTSHPMPSPDIVTRTLTQRRHVRGQDAEITAERRHIDLLHLRLIVEHLVGRGEGQLHGTLGVRARLHHANATGGQHSGGAEQRHGGAGRIVRTKTGKGVSCDLPQAGERERLQCYYVTVVVFLSLSLASVCVCIFAVLRLWAGHLYVFGQVFWKSVAPQTVQPEATSVHQVQPPQLWLGCRYSL